MAAGTAERIYTEDPSLGPVVITTDTGRARWHPLWQDNPAVYRPDESPPPSLRRLLFGGQHLPYFPPLDTPTGRRWPSDWRVRDNRPSLYLTADEQQRGRAVRDVLGPFILLEPTGRDRLSPNRVWPIDRWQALVDELRYTIPFVLAQLNRPAAIPLAGVELIPHDGFRDACSVLAYASLFVGTEGGLSIAAGALRRAAIILLSPCGPPADVIGFPEHVHIVDDDPATPCGYLTYCAHCAAAWQRLSVATVAAAIRRVVQPKGTR